MEVRTLGNLAALGCASCDEGPPSSQSILALYRGESGALFKVLTSTALRGVLIAPGVFVAARWAGARGGKLALATVGGSLVSAVGITAFLALYYAWKKPAVATAQAIPAGSGDAPVVDPALVAAQQQVQGGMSPAALVPQSMQHAVDTALTSAQAAGTAALSPASAMRSGFASSAFGSRPW